VWKEQKEAREMDCPPFKDNTPANKKKEKEKKRN